VALVRRGGTYGSLLCVWEELLVVKLGCEFKLWLTYPITGVQSGLTVKDMRKLGGGLVLWV
jgi:hypothetical protein